LVAKDAKYTSFIKMELYPMPATELESKIPRLIQAPTETVKTLMGPWFVAFSKHYAKRFNEYENTTYAPGLTPFRLGAWMKENEILGYELFYNIDFSRWDSTVCTTMLKSMADFYSKCGMDNYLVDFLKMHCLKITGYTQHFKYSVEGTVRSGEPQTTFGNTIMNLAINRVLFGSDCRIIAAGDDCLVAVKQPIDMETYYKNCDLLGLKPKIALVKRDLATFCSGWFYPCKINGIQGFVLASKPGRQVAKFGYHLGRVDKNSKMFMKGAALSRLPHDEIVPYLKNMIEFAIKWKCKPKYSNHVDFRTDVQWTKDYLPGIVQRTADTERMIMSIYGRTIQQLEDLKSRSDFLEATLQYE
jgi:hypothetical protein